MSANTVHIDILSDIVCPWCAIGYWRLRRAIEAAGMDEAVSIQWHPFELNPNMSAEGENLRAHLAQKYGTTLEGSIEARRRITELGNELDFAFRYFDEMKMWNTRLAHILIQWALPFGKQTEISEALFRAYFGEGRNVSDSGTLLDIADGVGLDVRKAQQVLEDASWHQTLEQSEMNWLQQGFRGVPVMVFDGNRVLSGAQDIETYQRALSLSAFDQIA